MSSSRQHVVIGGNGSVGRLVVAELRARGLSAVPVHRSPGDDPSTVVADFLDPAQAVRVTGNASHLYLCLGLKYDTAVWQRDWPVIMANAIEAASRSGAKIIFLDNIYMYGPKPLLNPITEDHPTNPPAIKGKVRKQIAESLLEAHKSGKVTAVIGRAGDFYGPGATNSPLYVSVLKEMLLGRRPLWMGNNAAVHSFIHIGDAARALVELALADDTYGQVWLLPASKPTPTVQALADTMGQILERPSGLLVVPKFALNGLTFIVPLMKELKEMLYQYETDYVISSFKFMKRFPSFTVTSYQQGITEMVEWFRKDSGK